MIPSPEQRERSSRLVFAMKRAKAIGWTVAYFLDGNVSLSADEVEAVNMYWDMVSPA